MPLMHYGSHGGAECGAHGDGRCDESMLTKDPALVTCPTCHGWLPIVANWKPEPVIAKSHATCINCGEPFIGYALRCWFGANEVGPFCERCDKAIKTHTLFRERR